MKNLYFIAPIVLLTMILFTVCQNKHVSTPTPTPTPIPTKVVRPTVNVYIENSGSMDGYVNGMTEFQQTVYNYLSDILISHTADSLNLYYINSEIIKPNLVLEDFIQKLNPKKFKEYGGKRGFSDIANVLKDVLEKNGKNQISILVTDGIFSPGRGQDAEQYLINQQIGIKREFAEYLDKNPNTAVIVYQLSSFFKGLYYNKLDKPIPINEQRPYYLWIIGDAKQLKELRNKVPDSKFINNGVQNVFTVIGGNHPVNYALNSNIGNVKISRRNSQTDIDNLGKDRGGKVRFAVNVDYSDLLQDDAYLLNPKNYETNSKYVLEIKPYNNLSYTHTLYFTSSDGKIYKGTVSDKLKAALPEWIESVNDGDGSTAAKGKTYGIKYQLGGVFDAFTYANKYYTDIKINIK